MLCNFTYFDIPDYVVKDIHNIPSNKPITQKVLSSLTPQTQTWCKENFSFKFARWSYYHTDKKIVIRYCQNCGESLTEKQLQLGAKWCCVYCKNTDPVFQQMAHQRLIEATGGQFGFKNKTTIAAAVKNRLDKYWPELDNQPMFIENEYYIPLDIVDLLTKCRGDDGRVKRESVNALITSEQRCWFKDNNTNIPILSFFLFKLNTKHVTPHYCVQCGSPIPVSTLILGGQTCSKACAQKQGSETWAKIREDNPEYAHDLYQQRNAKLFETNMKRYGVRVASQSEEVRAKTKQTNLQRYGCEHALSSKQIQEKARQSCLDKYGVEYYASTEQCKNRRIQTCLDKYGTKHASQSESVKAKIRATCQEKYGADSYLASEGGQEAVRATLVDVYGEDVLDVNSERNKRVAIERALREHSHKFGNINSSHVDLHVGVYRINHIDEIYEQFRSRNIEIGCSYDDFVCHREVPYRCSVCGYEWNDVSTNCTKVKCPICSSKPRSNQEAEFCKMIQSLYEGEIVTNTRKILNDGKEIDVWLPKLRLGFEFDGVFWHNDKHMDEDYHYEKKMRALSDDINLVHIFSNFWEIKPKVVEQTINKLLGEYELIDQCQFEVCQYDQIKDFVDLNSLTLYDHCDVAIQAISQNKVVAVGLEIDGYLHIVECPNVKLSEDVIVLMMSRIHSPFVVLDSNLYDLNWWNSGHLKHVCFTSSPYYYTKKP